MPPHPRILIVEDDALFRELLVLMLRRVRPQLHLIEAHDGQAAYTCYQQHGADLIITDDQMPLMTGTDLIHALRAAQDTLPIILLATRTSAHDVVRGDPYTVFAPKPIRIDDLLLIIDMLLAP